MANPNLMLPEIRQMIVKEIKSEENKRRKAESLKRFEVYRERQDRYIVEKLQQEFSEKTVREMRKITSVNLCPRIVDQLASIYNTAPDRDYENASEQEQIAIDALYESAKVDVKLLQANRYFKLNDQAFIQVIPRDGKINLRVLLPHHVDVIPDEMNPEKAFCYIISTMDKFEYLNNNGDTSEVSNPSKNPLRSTEYIDGRNQHIADADDYRASLERYEVWTDELNFIMDGKGNILSEDVSNPIADLPFVDISAEKDFEFFVRRGNGIVNFAVDFGAQLSDVANIIKLQGYAQAIVYAEKQPENMVVGPNHILFMQIDPNSPGTAATRFEFANPGSDLNGSLEFLEMTLRLFLTSKGVDPKTISGKLDAQTFGSGIERMLSMIEKFEASKSDIELFRWAEKQVFDLMVKWSNFYQGDVSVLKPGLQNGIISDEVSLTVQFTEPQAVQTKTDKEDSIIKLLDKGLVTRERAIMEVWGIGEDGAQEMLEKINEDRAARAPVVIQSEDDEDQDQDQENIQDEPIQ